MGLGGQRESARLGQALVITKVTRCRVKVKERKMRKVLWARQSQQGRVMHTPGVRYESANK